MPKGYYQLEASFNLMRTMFLLLLVEVSQLWNGSSHSLALYSLVMLETQVCRLDSPHQTSYECSPSRLIFSIEYAIDYIEMADYYI